MKTNIAIDGPSGSGKGTIAKLLASKLNYNYLDTGAMYRAVALYLKQKNVSVNSFDKSILNEIKLSFSSENKIELNKVEVEHLIRNPEISQLASDFSTNSDIREFLKEQQQKIIKNGGFIAEGRDIGTVIMPESKIKIFLNASLEERAKRRLQDFKKQGLLFTLDEVISQIKERDHQDTIRKTSPLTKAKDAIEIDNTTLSIDEQINFILALVEKINS